jgi:2-polyprenyl-6-methoxyphenol hydroxylase-like FAD-dependent oxidoreductase
MNLQAYQAAKIQSFFDLGLTFSVSGEQLAVNGLSQFPAEDQAMIQTGIRDHKSEIMAETNRLQNRLKQLVHQSENSTGLNPAAIEKISDEGNEITQRLSAEMVRRIFRYFQSTGTDRTRKAVYSIKPPPENFDN